MTPPPAMRARHSRERTSLIPEPPGCGPLPGLRTQRSRPHQADPEMADLFEFLIGTGLRKGEALGLHWDDVPHPHQHVP